MDEQLKETLTSVYETVATALDAKVNCQHCSAELPGGFFALCKASSTVTMALKPAPGEMFSLKSFAGLVEGFAGLMRQASEDLGVEAEVFLSSVSMRGEEVVIEALIARKPVQPAAEGGANGG